MLALEQVYLLAQKRVLRRIPVIVQTNGSGFFVLHLQTKTPARGRGFSFQFLVRLKSAACRQARTPWEPVGEPPRTGQMKTSYAGLPYSPARRRLRRTMARTPPPLRPWRGRQGKLSAGPRPGGGVLYCRGRHKIRKLSRLDGKRNY